ncbi:DUF2249 domain-containing protein [Streptomyces naganishii]|uniref:Hemerythrin HHE cation binding domain-containing protein n=1 Tax=Streptomyces naganishii JCM 4654 TaxID=1306179 RepID=A0A918Y5A1_9ACTN|nr:DUF2249 domain-containing protein [Streptomyces naganishii]GHD90732.1 hypothetical protein GCM10010508_36480 [Streptomyces naganishii JCM 4654]
MSALTLASAPEDATALEAAEAHHAHLVGQMAGHVGLLLTAAESDPRTVEGPRTGLVAFCERDLLPHAAAEEDTLYAAAHRLPDARLLVEALIGEHRRLAALVDALRGAAAPVAAAADARALQVLFEEHVVKENGMVLSLLAREPGVSLAQLLGDMHGRVGHHTPTDGAAGARDGRGDSTVNDQEPEETGCGGACGCGGADEAGVPELDVRQVPHALRHATVFGALDAVPAGGAMVLVAPHDPLPLLAQIEHRAPGAFAVEYLQRGPEAWRLLLSHH